MTQKCKDCYYSITIIEENRVVTYCDHSTSISMTVEAATKFGDLDEIINGNPAKDCWYYTNWKEDNEQVDKELVF